MKKESETQSPDLDFVNPIDPDKITETPHLLPYAHTLGGVVIHPIDKGKVKGRAMAAMYEQVDMQLDQIRQQIALLAQQAKIIQDRVAISETIYHAELPFEPLVGFTYHLYRRDNGKALLSMVGPQEWGLRKPYAFVATVKLLADHTWDILTQEDSL